MFDWVLNTPLVDARNCIEFVKTAEPVEKLYFVEVRFIHSESSCDAKELVK